MIWVLLLTVKLVAFVPPNVTAVAPVKLDPAMTTLVPPAVVPELGDTDVTPGANCSVTPEVADRHFEFAQKVADLLLEKDFRVEADLSDKRMQAKIRDAEKQKMPYILVIGDAEMAANAVKIRLRGGEDLGMKPVAEFLAMLERVVSSRTLALTPQQ